MLCEIDGSHYYGSLEFPSSNPTTSPARLQFQRDKYAHAMTICSDAPPVSMSVRHSTMGSIAPSSGQDISLQLPRAENFLRSISMPSTPSRRYTMSASSPAFQQLSRVYAAPYTESWVEQQLSSSPSPLPKIPPLPGCGLSPSTLNAEGTPFDRHFKLSQSWHNSDPDMSPIARRISDDNITTFLPESGHPSNQSSGGSCVPSTWSLMEKLPSLHSFGHPTFSPGFASSPAMHVSERSWSPVSCLSALTPLPSPERPLSDNVSGGLSSASSLCSPILGQNSSTARHSRDNHGLYSTSRRSLRTASRAVLVQSSKHPLPADHDEKRLSCRTKRARTSGDPTAVDLTSQIQEPKYLGIPSQRRLPSEVSRHPDFPLFYRRYPISSFLQLDTEEASLFNLLKHPGGICNPPRDPRDLYTPRFVKGIGRSKIGLCPICVESPLRGGRGQKIWLSTKFSAFNYHMQFAHGVSATTGRPFSPPLSYRTSSRRNTLKLERSEILEGKCHKCKKWVPVESIKDCEVKVKELFWWKHAATCHRGSQVPGDDDFYEHDDVLRRLEGLGF
ncbi:uncharacterized protein EDB93DRAFT_201986 [Suillus bovinus]|uniref:uncharacterized protein n=1 Tax=Suillus bovinus TaxID=48563 RepID=UPI001B881AEF|nr:uncharacterized protein EDB93DRAFT_201986 [Suillus bovinus]KAG2127602.1 hypothetical protein EDB93DRAFT_201986 [Suillus bovinus]